MNIEIGKGDNLRVTLKDSDGGFNVLFSSKAVQILADLPDSEGREGLIYNEKFGGEKQKPFQENSLKSIIVNIITYARDYKGESPENAAEEIMVDVSEEICRLLCEGKAPRE